MQRPHRHAPGAVAALGLILLAGCSLGGGSSEGHRAGTTARNPAADTTAARDMGRSVADRSDQDQLLFLLAGKGRITDGRLDVADLDDRVTWVSDRPHRKGGWMPPGGLLAAWETMGFADDPPNAILSTPSGTYDLELSQPSHDARAKSLSFAVAPVGGDPLPTGELGDVELFVDDAAACTLSDPAPYAPMVQSFMWTAVSTQAAQQMRIQVPTCQEVLDQFGQAFAAQAQTTQSLPVSSTPEMLGQTWQCTGGPYYVSAPDGWVPTPNVWICTSPLGYVQMVGLPPGPPG